MERTAHAAQRPGISFRAGAPGRPSRQALRSPPGVAGVVARMDGTATTGRRHATWTTEKMKLNLRRTRPPSCPIGGRVRPPYINGEKHCPLVDVPTDDHLVLLRCASPHAA